MQPSIGRAMLVSPQPLPVPSVTHVAPQASVWPGLPGVQGQGAQLPPGGLPPAVVQLPPGGQHLPLLQLLPWELHPGMAPPMAPAHCWGHSLLAGTPQPQQPMGLWPGAVFHGEPPQSAGSCLLQASSSPVLLPAPSVQQQVLPVPCTLPTSWEQAVGPFGDAVVLTEDQGHPVPTDVCPHPTTAPLTCSTAALESGAATTSADISQDITDIDELLTWMNNGVESTTEIPDDIPDMDDLLSWVNNEVTSPLEVPQQNQDLVDVLAEGTKHTETVENGHDELLPELNAQERAELLQWIDATQPPSPAVPSSLNSSPFIAALPDFPWASTELSREAEADARPISDLFWRQPACCGQLSESLPFGHLMEEARQRQPRVVLTRLALPPGCISCHVPDDPHGDGTGPAECPAPACTTGKDRSRGHEQRAGSVPTRKRKLPLGQDAPGQKRRLQVKLGGLSTSGTIHRNRPTWCSRRHSHSQQTRLPVALGSSPAPVAHREQQQCSRGTSTGPSPTPPNLGFPQMPSWTRTM
ncbi:uncharacterized protein LOC116237102 [Phasianus colchicus]|uniref:uncharacterized protein LOC116237102 n=1 Tax=Phasianus colchicus TaxID=9054 RepID=UPI00129D88D4|nr:uncharacterized protein LOC116237102 [Phasianus colchicus]